MGTQRPEDAKAYKKRQEEIAEQRITGEVCSQLVSSSDVHFHLPFMLGHLRHLYAPIDEMTLLMLSCGVQPPVRYPVAHGQPTPAADRLTARNRQVRRSALHCYLDVAGAMPTSPRQMTTVIASVSLLPLFRRSHETSTPRM